MMEIKNKNANGCLIIVETTIQRAEKVLKVNDGLLAASVAHGSDSTIAVNLQRKRTKPVSLMNIVTFLIIKAWVRDDCHRHYRGLQEAGGRL